MGYPESEPAPTSIPNSPSGVSTAHKLERLPAPCRSAWFRSGYCRCASSPYACDPRPSEPTHEAGHTPRASMHPATNARTHTLLVLKSLIAYSRPCVLRRSTSAAHVSGDSTATPSSRCTKTNKRCRLPRRMHAQYIGCIIALVPAAHALRRLHPHSEPGNATSPSAMLSCASHHRQASRDRRSPPPVLRLYPLTRGHGHLLAL
jgi:hypothetical protein